MSCRSTSISRFACMQRAVDQCGRDMVIINSSMKSNAKFEERCFQVRIDRKPLKRVVNMACHRQSDCRSGGVEKLESADNLVIEGNVGARSDAKPGHVRGLWSAASIETSEREAARKIAACNKGSLRHQRLC